MHVSRGLYAPLHHTPPRGGLYKPRRIAIFTVYDIVAESHSGSLSLSLHLSKIWSTYWRLIPFPSSSSGVPFKLGLMLLRSFELVVVDLYLVDLQCGPFVTFVVFIVVVYLYSRILSLHLFIYLLLWTGRNNLCCIISIVVNTCSYHITEMCLIFRLRSLCWSTDLPIVLWVAVSAAR